MMPVIVGIRSGVAVMLALPLAAWPTVICTVAVLLAVWVSVTLTVRMQAPAVAGAVKFPVAAAGALNVPPQELVHA